MNPFAVNVARQSVSPQFLQNDSLIGYQFNNRLWRQLLTETCREIDVNHLGLEVISPFGFELLEDKSFLSHKLRRFYAYLGAPRQVAVDQEQITAQFIQVLFAKLRQICTRLVDDVVIVIENHQLTKLCPDGYQCQLTDKLIDIQFRPVDVDILTDYANYAIAALAGLHHEKGEGRDFRTNQLWRWRLYQLYIMQEQLFGHLLPAMTFCEHKQYKAIFEMTSNMIQLFYAPDSMMTELSEPEHTVIFHLIKPRIAAMYEMVQSRTGNNKVVSCQAYHSEDILELTLDAGLYQQVMDKIKRTYLAFG